MLKKFDLIIMTPRENFFNGQVTQLNLEIFNGRIGFLAEHIPTVSSIKTSKFSIIQDGIRKEGVTIGGIVYMDGAKASIITSRIDWVENIDKEHARNRLTVHKKRFSDEEVSKMEKEILAKKILFYQKQLE